jgi:hypothetical protein
MTTYKELFGKYVQNYASDPTSSDAEGQIWYNTTSGTFKTALGSYGVWSSGGSLNTARNGVFGLGTQTAGLATGGITTVRTGATEAYNGTSWTTSPATLNEARNAPAGSCGTQTSGLIFSGDPGGSPRFSTATESYNGTAWTTRGALNTGKRNSQGASNGTQTAALNFGGLQDPVGNINNSESYNGTSWTATPTINTARRSAAGSGSQTAALLFGGVTTVYVGTTESWNGSTWTTLPANMNTARGYFAGCGTQTAALAFGGTPPTPAANSTESWNGTSWTSVNGMGTARYQLGGAGTQTSALAFGGAIPPQTAVTEEWNISVVVPVAGSWSSGGNLNTGKYNSAAGGTQTSTVNFGGYVFPNSATNISESYNGTSWTNTPNMNTARGALAGAGASNTSALAFSGNTLSGSPSYTTATESFNGSSWTNVNSLNTSRGGGAGGGIQTSAIMISGYDGSSNVTNTELWNGTSWTTSPAGVNTAARGLAGVATSSSSALKFGGYSTAVTGATESWNGSSWTSVNSLNTIRSGLAGAGTQTLALAFAGDTGPGSGLTATELWNGTSWTTSPNGLAYARYAPAGSGTQAAALCIGGIRDSASPQFRTDTEEWTGPSTTLNYKTLTTS